MVFLFFPLIVTVHVIISGQPTVKEKALLFIKALDLGLPSQPTGTPQTTGPPSTRRPIPESQTTRTPSTGRPITESQTTRPPSTRRPPTQSQTTRPPSTRRPHTRPTQPRTTRPPYTTRPRTTRPPFTGGRPSTYIFNSWNPQKYNISTKFKIPIHFKWSPTARQQPKRYFVSQMQQ